MSYHFGNMSPNGQYGSAELQSKINELKPILDQLDAALDQALASTISGNSQLQNIQSFAQSAKQTLTSTMVPMAVPSNYPISDAGWRKLDDIEKQAQSYISQISILIQAAPPPSPSAMNLPSNMAISNGGSPMTMYIIIGVIGLTLMLFLLLRKKKPKSYEPPSEYPPLGYYPPPSGAREQSASEMQQRLKRCKKH